MVWCTSCFQNVGIRDQDNGMILCNLCGKVIDDADYDEGPNFITDPNGHAQMVGKTMDTVDSGYSLSRERTIRNGKYEIEQLVINLKVGGGDTIINMAHHYYKLAVDHNFTRGRRTTHVAAACLYIACRQSEKPYLLIDFSDYLQISVYAIGAVFLQLCQVLLLSEHPVFQKLIDPTLFIQRFTECLGVNRYQAKAVSNTAIQIVASMKRDWMQTGRKPSGICGVALYIAALSHGLDYTKADVVAVVHVCEATLTKRLIEFENTDSGGLTIEELETVDDFHMPFLKQPSKSGEVLCKHKDKGADYFCHGLCEECYDEFTKLSGGLKGGADPPAFQRAERKRFDTAKRAEECDVKEAAPGKSCETPNSGVENSARTPRKEVASDSVPSMNPEDEGETFGDDLDPETLSDIDDVEVEGYLHNEEETQYKKVIWEAIYKEYLEEQAAKEALAAELVARGLVGEEVKKKKRKHNEDAKGSTPAGTPTEATRDMLKRKRSGLKINLEAVNKLYNRTEDGKGDADEKNEMDFGGEVSEDNGDGETFDNGYDYAHDKCNGYGDDAGAADNDYDPFDFW